MVNDGLGRLWIWGHDEFRIRPNFWINSISGPDSSRYLALEANSEKVIHKEKEIIMSIDKILVGIFGFLGIVFTYWFFLMKKEKQVNVVSEVDITVSGGFSPEVISIPKGKPTKINFLRIDPSDCLSEVVLSDFKIRKELPMNQKVSIEVTAQKIGEYKFTCGMNMYHGKIIVK